ncbi:MAG: hypothetical protein Tsb002_04190 [Wenzhouxiangellaceae bacterium]
MNPSSSTMDSDDAITILDQLLAVMSPHEQEAVAATADHVLSLCGNAKSIDQFKLMVAYGGGKDSTYTVAFMRAVQLSIAVRQGRTFILRVANMRHGGVTRAVSMNIHHVYQRLGLLDDSRTELITVDHDQIATFDVNRPLPQRMLDINRQDILMNGHLSGGDGRPTFCNSCNFSVASFYGQACWWDGGVDVVVTGDSSKEQKHYYTWIIRLAQQLGIDPTVHRQQGFHGLLAIINRIAHQYYSSLYGAENDKALALRDIHAGSVQRIPHFMSIYDAVSYRVDDHWKLVVDFLGFEFDEMAFSFTESDCFNPALMAHLRGLKVEYVHQGDYLTGIREYLQLADKLMRKKEIPQVLIDLAMSRYTTAEDVQRMHDKATEYAAEVFALSQDQLICLVFSPFIGQGKRLRPFIDQLHPQRASQIKTILALLDANTTVDDGNADTDGLVSWLQEISGLSLKLLRRLYASPDIDFGHTNSMISLLRQNDPHKAAVDTVDPDNGRPIKQWLSGR